MVRLVGSLVSLVPLHSVLQWLDPLDNVCRYLPERRSYCLGQFPALYTGVMFLPQHILAGKETLELWSEQDTGL